MTNMDDEVVVRYRWIDVWEPFKHLENVKQYIIKRFWLQPLWEKLLDIKQQVSMASSWSFKRGFWEYLQ